MLASRYINNGQPYFNLNELQGQMKEQVDSKVLSKEYVFEEINCEVCGESDFELLSEKDRYGLYMSVQSCKNCGLIQTNPRMDQESYNQFYNTEYRKLYVGQEVAKKSFFSSQRRKGLLIIDYLKSKNLINKPWSEFSVLEVGCGAGGILEEFKALGAQVLGIDLGEEYVEFGKAHAGLDLRVSFLKDLTLDDKPDLIIYSHVMEHILDVKGELSEIKSRCHDQTLVYVEVPGVKNIHKNYFSDFLRYLQNAHTYHFTISTLKNLFQQNGFKMLSGDEYVRSVFAVSGNRKEPIENDFAVVNEYLHRIEKRRTSLRVLFGKYVFHIKTFIGKFVKLLKN